MQAVRLRFFGRNEHGRAFACVVGRIEFVSPPHERMLETIKHVRTSLDILRAQIERAVCFRGVQKLEVVLVARIVVKSYA